MILINGAKGKVGTVLSEHWADKPLLCRDAESPKLYTVEQSPETFVHLALKQMDMSMTNDCDYALGLLLATLDWCADKKVRRIIFTSSTLAEPERYAVEIPLTWYGAAKAASEAILRCYAEEHQIPVVCLRIGLFEPFRGIEGRPAWERRLAVSPANLMAWFDAALAFNEPRCVVWNALGGEG